MKFDSKTRTQIVTALDKLAVAQNTRYQSDPLIEQTGEILSRILHNQEDWRPENWSIKDY